MKILKILGIVVLLVIVTFGAFVYFNSKPLSQEQVTKNIEDTLKDIVNKDNISQALLYVQVPHKDYEIKLALDQNETIDASTPFHVASVGKAFTATLIGMAIDEDKLSLDDKIVDYLDSNLLKNLFVYENKDYMNDVTIGQLLNHTSGLADYFADPVKEGKDMAAMIVEEKDKLWKPEDLIAFTAHQQVAISKPGQSYHYSDSGYILLGLILEAVYEQEFGYLLESRIFTPLDMTHSYLTFYEPVSDNIADVWFNGVNIKSYNSLSIDWSGGGIISTLDDLAKFVIALNEGQVISEQTLNTLYSFDEKFMTGVHYGYGFMEYHFDEFFPTLGFLPNLKGHMGVLGTQMFYDKATGTLVIMSLGSTDASEDSVRSMIQILSTIERLKR